MARILGFTQTGGSRNTKTGFIVIASEAGGGWEPISVPADYGLVPSMDDDIETIDWVRIMTPVEKQEEGPVAGIDLVAQFDGTVPGAEFWDLSPARNPVWQMLAADTDPHIFFVEFGRTHSVPK